MKVRLSGFKQVFITGEYIKLDALLKVASVVSTGGEAKLLVQNGMVFVGSEQCTQRGRKIRPGDMVRYDEHTLLVKRAI